MFIDFVEYLTNTILTYFKLFFLSDSIKISCPGCHTTFNKNSKLTFHRSYCNQNTEGTTVDFDETTRLDEVPRSNLKPKVPENQEKLINDQDPGNCTITTVPIPSSPAQNFLRDDFLDENVPFAAATPEPSSSKNNANQNVFEDGTTPFKMPDNFDLPDEIIQEQLPSARSFITSTPIRGYADPKKELADKKGTSKLKDKGTNKGIPSRKDPPSAGGVGEALTASGSITKEVTKPHPSSKGKHDPHRHDHKKTKTDHHNHRRHDSKKKQDGDDHDRDHRHSSNKSHQQREVKHRHGEPEISHQEIPTKKTKVAHGGFAASSTSTGADGATTSSLKKGSSTSGFDDLAAKKRRMMLKLREDELVVKRDEKRKRPRQSPSPQRIREKTSHHRYYYITLPKSVLEKNTRNPEQANYLIVQHSNTTKIVLCYSLRVWSKGSGVNASVIFFQYRRL